MGRCTLISLIFAFTRDEIFLALFSSEFFLDKYWFACPGIEFGVVHQAGIGAGCGSEDLHLFGVDLELLAAEALERGHVLFAAAGMGGDHVVGQELRLACFVGQFIEFGVESQ